LLQRFESELKASPLDDFNLLLSKAKNSYGYPRTQARLTKDQKLQLHKMYRRFKLEDQNVDKAIEEVKKPLSKFPLNLIFNFKLPEELILKIEAEPPDVQKFMIIYKKVLGAEFFNQIGEIKNAVFRGLHECYIKTPISSITEKKYKIYED